LIGNDVVDLGDEDSVVRRHHVRFDSRVFAAEELERLEGSVDPEGLRWSMWAAKEAAFKLLRAGSADAVFAPSRFVVRPAGHNAATVDVDGTRLGVDFQRTTAYVHAIVRPLAFSALHMPNREAAVTPREAAAAAVAVHEGDAVSASEAVRRLAVASVSRLLGENAAVLSVGNADRVPLLLKFGRRLPGSLSLSHHGRFVAFAWCPAATRSGRRATSGRRESPGASRVRS